MTYLTTKSVTELDAGSLHGQRHRELHDRVRHARQLDLPSSSCRTPGNPDRQVRPGARIGSIAYSANLTTTPRTRKKAELTKKALYFKYLTQNASDTEFYRSWKFDVSVTRLLTFHTSNAKMVCFISFMYIGFRIRIPDSV